jgi:hypothetical protein
MENGGMNMRLRKKHSGFGVIVWIVMIPLLIIAVLILTVGFYEGRKAYWDHKVREMCEKDGGATVFEKVHISQDEYKRLGGTNGVIPVPAEPYKKDSPYYARTVTQIIREWNPEVKKRTTEIIRNADREVIGKQIIYSRVGGDFPTIIGHPTYFSCIDVKGISLDIEKQIFVIYGGEK